MAVSGCAQVGVFRLASAAPDTSLCPALGLGARAAPALVLVCRTWGGGDRVLVRCGKLWKEASALLSLEESGGTSHGKAKRGLPSRRTPKRSLQEEGLALCRLQWGRRGWGCQGLGCGE